MGQDSKYGKVTTEKGNIPDDEPVFVLRAQDIASVETLANYILACDKWGSSAEHIEQVYKAIDTFRTWRETHRVKTPDSEITPVG